MTHPVNRQEIERIIERENERTVQGIANYPSQNNGISGVVDGMAMNAGLIFTLGTIADAIPKWSIYPAARDRALRQFYKTEPILVGAAYSMATRIKSLDWKLTGEEDLQPDVMAIFEAADRGEGLQTLIEKTITDLCSQDNGFFWELIGAGDPDQALLGGVVEGVNHLDPAQCYRTFDFDYPVLYIDPLRGTRHRIHRTRLVSSASFPQPNELARGIGYCPVSRVLLSAQLMKSIQQYRYEKSSGTFERAIGWGTGITQVQLQQLLSETNKDDENAGFVRFGKIPFYVSPRKEVSLNILDLASIPDGFDLMSETDIYVYTVALCFGVDAREFWTATSVGATKADASVQHLKSQGKGIADFITIIEHAINRYIVPDGMIFEFDFTDDEQDKAIAERNKVVVDTLVAIKNAGAIDEVQLQAMLIHMNVLDAEILEDAQDIAIPKTGDSLSAEEPAMFPPMPPNPMNPQQPPMPMDMPAGEGENENEDEPEERSLAEKTQEQYRRALYAAVRSYWDGVITDTGLVSQMDSIIRRHYVRASYDAAKEAGMNVGDITSEESDQLQTMIASEQSYVVGFVTWLAKYHTLKDSKISVAFDRIQMWAGRYELIKSKFLTIFAKNKKLMWKVGDTEHCIDCLTMDGRVYRASTIDKYNIQPRSKELACGGYRCQCRWVIAPAGTPVTKGRPPRLVGRSGSGRRDYRNRPKTGDLQGDFTRLGRYYPDSLKNAGISL